MAKVAVQYFYDSFVGKQTEVHIINICGENRHLRQARKRYVAFKRPTAMTNKLKIYLFFTFCFSAIQYVYSQTFTGRIFNQEDSLPVMFVNIVQIDSSGNLLKGTTTNENGEFTLRLLKNTEMIKITHLPEFAEIHVKNLNVDIGDAMDLDTIPMIKAPNYLQVQFNGISKKKERRNQSKLVNDYNRKVKAYQNRDVEINGKTISLNADSYKQNDTERLQLIYILNLNEIKK